MVVNDQFAQELRAIIREELARVGLPSTRWLRIEDGQPVTAQDVKDAMDAARRSVIGEIRKVQK